MANHDEPGAPNQTRATASPALRARFAPSPTGYLHVGGARTALFNWLLARSRGGCFILRIEDTDLQRSSEEMTRVILDSMRWLGMDWDEGPFFQSQRLGLHRRTVERLLSEAKAYPCFCPPQRLEESRRAAEREKRAWIYDRTCLGLTAEEALQRRRAGVPGLVRFRVPEGETVFQDLIQGEIRFDNRLIEDFALQRSDGMPTYHLSVVSDDIDMRISHVIRGADHISNTPKQILLYEALGQAVPEFGHLSLILGPDRKRLSKRHGATAVEHYRTQGILPDALINYLALLGWSPGGDREVMAAAELVERFDLSRVNKANAVFDVAKLEWFNAQHLQQMEIGKLTERVRNEFFENGLLDRVFASEPAQMEAAVALLRSRCKTLHDFSRWGRAFFLEEFEIDPEGRKKYLSDPAIFPVMQELAGRYLALAEFSLASTEQVLRDLAAERGVKPGALIGAVRVALTGNAVAPGLFEVMLHLGRERTVARIRRSAAAP
ncbi:MAG: glutamate--tRNA ligase [Acidobacteria bacterium]|nr:glutamate--tRNA ligase [Acidobacteriota bacterium]